MIDTKIKLARVDFRLMHGQVVTKWIQQVNADSILIVDDELAKDEFMSNVFLMAAPVGIKVGIREIEKAVRAFNNNTYKNKNLLILFKSVQNAYKAIELGLPLSDLQIGGLGSSVGKKMISNELSLNEDEFECLEKIENMGVNVNFQVTPNDQKLSFQDVKRKIVF